MQPSRKGILLLLFSMLIVCGFSLLTYAESRPVWEIPFDSEVKWITLTPTGQLLVTTDKSLTGVNADSGNILWKLDKSVSPASAFTPTGQMLMILDNTLVSLNPENGSINWPREDINGANVSLLAIFPELPYALMFIDTTYQVQDNMSRAQTDIARTKMIVFDYATGKEICNTDSLGFFQQWVCSLCLQMAPSYFSERRKAKDIG